jgi:hypothetical protein
MSSGESLRAAEGAFGRLLLSSLIWVHAPNIKKDLYKCILPDFVLIRCEES